MIVDHPSIMDLYRRDTKSETGEITEDHYLRLSAGDEVIRLKTPTIGQSENKIIDVTPKEDVKKEVVTNENVKIISFRVFFPNNLSGVDLSTDNLLNYLTQGKDFELNGGNGYEMGKGALTQITNNETFSYIVDDKYKKTKLNYNSNYNSTTDDSLNAEAYNDEGTNFSFEKIVDDLKNRNSENYNLIKNAKSIEVWGSASNHGDDTTNRRLATNRANSIVKWIKTINNEATYTTKVIYESNITEEDNSVNSKNSKEKRFTRVIISSDPNAIDENKTLNEMGYQTIKVSDDVDIEEIGIDLEMTKNSDNGNGGGRKIRSMYGYYTEDGEVNDNKTKLFNDEAYFYESISADNTVDTNFIMNKISERIKYFHPAFHSSTPEGFNSRLTFLHQCTRQGPTGNTLINEGSITLPATNMAFGRPPICILRMGDFYNTKIVITSLTIDYEPLLWDLNEEGIGVQPMFARVTLGFNFIGGSDLTGPIARLQNAITHNFFANTSVYDDRSDSVIEHNKDNRLKKYRTLYNPKEYEEK